jgi:hypothetical protein
MNYNNFYEENNDYGYYIDMDNNLIIGHGVIKIPNILSKKEDYENFYNFNQESEGKMLIYHFGFIFIMTLLIWKTLL